MQSQSQDKIIFFLFGTLVGMVLTLAAGLYIYKVVKGADLNVSFQALKAKLEARGNLKE